MPQPKIFSRSTIMSFLKILSYSAFRQLRILPRTGIIAWKNESLPCLQEPSAESPSTIYSSRFETSFVSQSTNFCMRLVMSSEPDSVFLMLTRSRSLFFARALVNQYLVCDFLRVKLVFDEVNFQVAAQKIGCAFLDKFVSNSFFLSDFHSLSGWKSSLRRRQDSRLCPER